MTLVVAPTSLGIHFAAVATSGAADPELLNLGAFAQSRRAASAPAIAAGSFIYCVLSTRGAWRWRRSRPRAVERLTAVPLGVGTYGEQGEDEAAARQRLDRAIAGIALPAFLQLCTEPLAGLVDTAYVGHLSRAALGGMSVAVAAQYSLTKLFNDPLLRVTTSLVASTPQEEKGDAVMAVLVLVAVLGACQAFCFGPGAAAAIQTMGVNTDSSMFEPAVAYLRVRAYGAPLGSALLGLTGVCRGLGDAKSPLYAAALATVVNIGLDPILIFGLGWGCGGAAAATVFAQGVGSALLALKLIRLRRSEELGDTVGHGFSTQVLRRVLSKFVVTAGIMIARNWGKVFCFTFLARQAALSSPVVAAAYGLTFQLGFATSQVAESLATSTQVLLAQALQAVTGKSGEYAFAPLPPRKAAMAVIQRGLQAGLVLSLFLGSATLLLQGRVLEALTSDGAVQATARAAMPCVLLVQMLKAIAYPTNGALMGAQDWSFSAVVLWLSGALGVGVFMACSKLALGGAARGAPSDLVLIWLGLGAFFGGQVVLGLARVASGRGPWRVLRAENAM